MPALLLCLMLVTQVADDAYGSPDRPRVLFFSHSAGFVHDVVKRPDPETLAPAEVSFQKMAANRYDVVLSQDCAVLDDLSSYDAVVFYTTGELPVRAGTRAGLVDWVRDGGAFIGVHCASDTFYEYPPFLEMVGGAFDGHPWNEQVNVRIEQRGHPSMVGLGGGFGIADEIYQFRDFQRHPVTVLLSLDPDSVDISLGKREDGDYPLAWWRDYGRGRVFYTALGHRPEVWRAKPFQWHLLAGIEWAMSGPDLGTRAPDYAQELMGHDASPHWKQRDGSDFAWTKLPIGVVEVAPGKGDLVSKESFGDALIHVEFRVPLEEDAEGQARGNSGVYVQGRYEVQVLDSFGIEQGLGDCAAIYGQHLPRENACRAPEEWQSYDIRFQAPRFDEDGEKTKSARMSVWHNGMLVHDDVVVDEPTLAGLATDEVPRGPLLLQDHGDLVQYRNVWVVPAEE